MDAIQKKRILAEAGTLHKATVLCEDLEQKIAALTIFAGDEDGRTAVEVYRTALRTVIPNAKEHL